MDEKLNEELEGFKKEMIELNNKSPINEDDSRLKLKKVGVKCEELGKYDEALRYYNECLEIEKRILPSNHSSIAMTLNNIGIVYKNQGKYESAIKYLTG
jgi:tetratricopeptide (TPR) repeat protein